MSNAELDDLLALRKPAWQFSLSSLFVVTAVVAVVLGIGKAMGFELAGLAFLGGLVQVLAVPCILAACTGFVCLLAWPLVALVRLMRPDLEGEGE